MTFYTEYFTISNIVSLTYYENAHIKERNIFKKKITNFIFFYFFPISLHFYEKQIERISILCRSHISFKSDATYQKSQTMVRCVAKVSKETCQPVCPEQANYLFDCVISNVTAGGTTRNKWSTFIKKR